MTFKTKKGEGGKKGRGGTLNHGSLLEHDNPKIILAAVSAFIQCSASPEVERWNENLNSINALILELANLEQVLDNWDCDIPDPRFRELLDFKSNYERLIKTKIRSTLPNLANSNLEISSDPCTFLWVLINQLKNVNIQHQIKVKKREEEVSRSLLDQLHKLKKKYVSNFEKILLLERKLSVLEDAKNRQSFDSYLSFKDLNFEKCSKHMCRRGAKKGGVGIEVIQEKNEGGFSPFKSTQDRDEYLACHFSNLYKKNPELGGDIKSFLGEKGLEHLRSRNQMLNNQDRLFF